MAKSLFRKAKEKLLRSRARFWNYLDWAIFRASVFANRYAATVFMIFLLSLIVASVYLIPSFSKIIGSHFATEAQFERLRSLTLGLGGALVGASAIAFALVMFAMQVNVERMPYGLFRKISSDKKILLAFFVTFALSIGIACLSLMPGREWVNWVVLGAFWGTLLVIVFLLYAYRRALFLINPIEQIKLLVEHSQRDLRVWRRRAKRAKPMLEPIGDSEADGSEASVPNHDISKLAFFNLNPYWTSTIRKSISQATSYSRRYSEQGDYDIANAALSAIVTIQESYIAAKGKTFFSNALLFQNPLTTDGLINETLEDLRQNVRLGVSRGDEQQIEQSLTAIAALAHIYMGIDYASDYSEKTHAHIAAGYLENAVESVVPHNMPDVLMEGIRLMGSTARTFVAQGDPTGSVSLVDKIGVIACTGAANDKFRPVTMTGMEQLSAIMIDLLRSNAGDTGFAIENLRNTVSMVAKLFLASPDTPIASRHSAYLAPYFSLLSSGGFLQGFTNIVNWLADADEAHDGAKAILRNVSSWADGGYKPIKEVLLEAIDKESGLAFDIIHWISSVFELLLAGANAPACDDRTAEDIRRHAMWILSVLSWIPDDKKAISFVENVRLTEILFKAALVARAKAKDQLFEDVRGLFFSWAIKGGKRTTGWGTLETSIYGLSALALREEDAGGPAKLKSEITSAMGQDNPPDQETLDRVATNVRRKAATLYREGHWGSTIEMAVSEADQQKLKQLLEEIADIISPGTVGAKVDIGLF